MRIVAGELRVVVASGATSVNEVARFSPCPSLLPRVMCSINASLCKGPTTRSASKPQGRCGQCASVDVLDIVGYCSQHACRLLTGHGARVELQEAQSPS